MVQGYYTLEEAARILGMSSQELNLMAQRKEVRAFQDRGSWRFRTQDIEELARRRGIGSNPDLPIGEAPKPRPHDSPAPRSKSPAESDVFHFSLPGEGDQVEIGQEMVSDPSGGSKKSGSKPRTPTRPITPKPGSDSDVRLVADGSDVGFKVASDSDVKLEDSGAKSKPGSGPKSKPPGSKPGRKQDSGVRLVPMDSESDSDVRIVADSTEDLSILSPRPKAGSDSDIRLEPSAGGPSSSKLTKRADDSFLTEEIDLDAELKKAEEAAKSRKPQSRTRPKTPLPPSPSTAPFELSEADLKTPSKVRGGDKAKTESSSEFDLSIEDQSSSSIELDSGELAPPKEEEVRLGDMPAGVTGASDSGINLQRPADSGISLEQGGDSSDEIEFELSLDAESTPKPVKALPDIDSSSEFELTLEDSARLAPASDVKDRPAGVDEAISETDFEVPALEEESGSEAMALEESDTDLESSDFDLALGEEDAASEEESGSQVVALEDEEEVDESAATIARPRRTTSGVVGEDEAGLGEEELGEELVVPGRRAVAAAAPADWGVFTPVVLLISVAVLFIVGLMSFELLHGMWGYRQPNKVSSPVVRAIAGMFYDQNQLPSE